MIESFDGDGPLEAFITNNAYAVPNVVQKNGRCFVPVTNNKGSITQHFHSRQGRLVAKRCGLGFPSSTMSFIFESTHVGLGAKSRYYLVKKSPLEASTKWKSTFSSEQIERVLAIVSGTRPGKVVAASMGLSSLG